MGAVADCVGVVGGVDVAAVRRPVSAVVSVLVVVPVGADGGDFVLLEVGVCVKVFEC